MGARAYTKILLCEPHCRGFEHAQFNAALIASVQAAFPHLPLVFLGEETHLSYIRSWLGEWDLAVPVEWHVMPIEDPSASYLRGTIQRLSAYRAPLKLVGAAGRCLVVYCSSAPKGLLFLKLLLPGRSSTTDVFLLFHNQLANLIPISTFNELKLIFSLPHPRSLRYVVLGESIRDRVSGLISVPPGALGAIDHPSLLAMRSLPTGSGESVPPVRFGFLGVSLNKGFDTFVLLARRIHAEVPGVAFSMVGNINHEADASRFWDILPDARVEPITVDEYVRRGEALTYAVWTAAPADYDLRASATFVDAMCLRKPGIYLRNRYVEHYFHRFGDIGYLCDDVEAMYREMKDISRNFPRERYLGQVKNIELARACFSPMHVGVQLRAILTGEPPASPSH